MRKILFITTSNLTTNPRLFKEIKVASQKYQITVLCFSLGNWSDKIDAQLQAALPGTTIHYIAAHRKHFFPWLFATLAHKAAAKVWLLLKNNNFLNAAASNKRSIQLFSHIALHKSNYKNIDLIVAHNLGTLYPAQQLSKQLNTPFIFDVEDYHPGERIENDAKHEKKRREFLMQRLLPKAKFITAASPLIGAEVEKLTGVPVSYISNSFHSSEFELKKNAQQQELKIIWFSQNINFGRGLELAISVLDAIKGNFSLTLVGNLNKTFAEEWLNTRTYIKVLAPLDQAELHRLLCNYDIGLALELSRVDFNRQIALSNKIFAYLQSGLYIIATDTDAQKQLLQEYPTHGVISEQTEEGLTKSVNFVLDNIARIREEKETRFKNARNVAYEQEGQKLLALWERLVDKKYNEESNHRISTFPPL